MRKITIPTAPFTAGLRSVQNGPMSLIKIHSDYDSSDDPNNPTIYKAAKPYLRFDYMKSVERSVILVAPNTTPLVIKRPSIESLLDEVDLEAWLHKLQPLFDDLQIYAKNSAIEKSFAYDELLLVVSAVEAKQTVSMLRNVFVTLFQAILKLYKSVKRLDIRATYDTLSNLWLEARYGWRPLIGELGTIHEMLTVKNKTGIHSAYGVKKSTDTVDTFNTYGDVTVMKDGMLFDYELLIGNITERTAKAGFNYLNKKDGRNDDLLSRLGLDIQSILSIGWELVPFSFVLDFFFNVGSMLQARNYSDQVYSFNHYQTNRFYGKLKLNCTRVSTPGKGGVNVPPTRNLDFWNAAADSKVVGNSYYSKRTEAAMRRFSERDHWVKFYTNFTSVGSGLHEQLIQSPIITDSYGNGSAEPLWARIRKHGSVFIPGQWQWDVLGKRCRPCFTASGTNYRSVYSPAYLFNMFGPDTALETVQDYFKFRMKDVTAELLPLWQKYSDLLYYANKDLAYQETLIRPLSDFPVIPGDRMGQRRAQYYWNKPIYKKIKAIKAEIAINKPLFTPFSHFFSRNQWGKPEQQARAFAWTDPLKPLTLTSHQLQRLSHDTKISYLNRAVLKNEFIHEATVDSDLNSGQWTDLAIFGEMLVSALGRRSS